MKLDVFGIAFIEKKVRTKFLFLQAVEPPKPAASPQKTKKSTSSRREELLKQLKAVEDAIARKRAKMQ